MSFEGHYQVICIGEFPHYFELPFCYGEEEGKPEFWRCEDCQADPAWINLVDDTNCDAVGHVELNLRPDGKVLQWPSPFKGTWFKKPADFFWVICERHHLFTGQTKEMLQERGGPIYNMQFRCPTCDGYPIWTKPLAAGEPAVKCVDFHELPALTDGTWAFIEGGKLILVDDLLRIFGLKALRQWRGDIEAELKAGTDPILDQFLARPGWGIDILGSLANQSELPEIWFKQDRNYPHTWLLTVESAQAILTYWQEREKRVNGL